MKKQVCVLIAIITVIFNFLQVYAENNKEYDPLPTMSLSFGSGETFSIRNGVRFGMSEKEIVSIEGEPAFRDRGSNYASLHYYTSAANKNVLAAFSIVEGKLQVIAYLFTEMHVDAKSYIEDFQLIEESLTSKYGNPKTTEVEWINDTYKVVYANRNDIALPLGYVKYISTWMVGDVIISHELYGSGAPVEDVLHSIVYSTLEHEVNRTNQTHNTDGL